MPLYTLLWLGIFHCNLTVCTYAEPEFPSNIYVALGFKNSNVYIVLDEDIFRIPVVFFGTMVIFIVGIVNTFGTLNNK